MTTISIGNLSATAISPQPRSVGGRTQALPSTDAVGKTASLAANGSLSLDQQSAVRKLQARDAEVRRHEAAHLAAASGIARGGAHFSYQRGPDGKLYAIGGDVSIDTSSVPGDPAATARKAEQIRRAALAPADPSSQDLNVAAAATQMLMQAQAAISRQRNAPGTSLAYRNHSDKNAVGTLIDISA